ncbi:MAG: phosphoesterase PA-phosphatase related protein [Parcubacteria group bacterium]|nr:phosphoesterase PA-phosphatase related protein [Parcubacteria group bacterium]
MLFKNWAKNLLFLLVYIFSGIALVTIIEGVVTGSELTPFNTAAEEVVSHFRTPLLTNIMVFVTNAGSPFFLSIAAIFLAIFIVLHRDTYDAMLYVVSMALALISFTLLKNMLHLPRPTGGLIHLSSWAFPSGHATIATAFFFATAYSFFDRFKSALWKTVLVAVSIAAAALVCFSRLYLGVHSALDILAGISLGLLCVSFTVLVFNIFLEERRSLRKRT